MNTIQISKNTMTDTVGYNATVSKMTGSEMEIVRATQEKRIMEMDEREVKVLAIDLIYRAKTRLGYNPTQTEQDYDAEVLMIADDLKSFKGLTGSEVSLALKSGVNGDFSTDGKVFWSSASFVQWVKRWVSEKKLEAMRKYTALEQAKPTEKPPMSEEEHKALSYEIAKEYASQRRKFTLQRSVITSEIDALRKELEGFDVLDEDYPIKKANIEAKLKNKVILLKKYVDFQVFSAHTLYEDVERFGIWKMQAEDKRALFSELQNKHPLMKKEELVVMAKSKAYNVFIQLLASEEVVLNGETK